MTLCMGIWEPKTFNLFLQSLSMAQKKRFAKSSGKVHLWCSLCAVSTGRLLNGHRGFKSKLIARRT